MAIPVSCDCGRSFQVGDQHAGKKARCPDCKSVLVIPEPTDALEEIPDEEPEETPRRRGVTTRPKAADEAPSGRVREGKGKAEQEEEEPKRPRIRRYDEEDDDEDDRDRGPKRSIRQRRRGTSGTSGTAGGGLFSSGAVNPSMGGGCLMMVGAAVWFVVGLYFDIIFFYPPVLFVLGIIAVFRGLANRDG